MNKEAKPRGIQSIYHNKAFWGGVVELENTVKKPVNRSIVLFRAGRKFLEEKYETVHEEINFMDLFAHSKSGECCEIEIKMADYDLYKERTKESKSFKHSEYKNQKTFCPNEFYFLVPTNLVKKCIKFCEDSFPSYGVLEFYSDNVILHKKSERLTDKKFNGEFLDFKGRKDFKHNQLKMEKK